MNLFDLPAAPRENKNRAFQSWVKQGDNDFYLGEWDTEINQKDGRGIYVFSDGSV